MKEKKEVDQFDVNQPADVMVVKITLSHTGISRTLVLPVDISLKVFKFIVADSVGFYGGHLFRYHSPLIADPFRYNMFLDEDDQSAEEYEAKVDSLLLKDLLPERGTKASLEYDFGDGWEFKFLRMATPKNAEPFTCRKCTGIDCFDDCGGPWGFLNILDILTRLADGKKITDGTEEKTAKKINDEEKLRDTDEDGDEENDWSDEEDEYEQNEVAMLQWAFGSELKPTPEFAKDILARPTPDEVTERLRAFVSVPSNFEDDDEDNEDYEEDDDERGDSF